MTNGISVELKDLINLQNKVQTTKYKSKAIAINNGHHITKIRGRGMEFSEVRNYQAGDEIRNMQWRVTARTGKPHVKLYEEERERPIIILADFSSTMFFGTRVCFKAVTAARLAALLSWWGIKNGDKVGGFLFTDDYHKEFLPKSQSFSILPMLASIADLTKQSKEANYKHTKKNLNHALCMVKKVAKPGSMLILISDFYQMNTETEHHLASIRKNHDILSYHICDQLELSPPVPATYAITNGEKESILDNTSNSVNINYHDYCKMKLQTLMQKLQNLKIIYNCVTSETNLENLINIGLIKN